MEAGFREFLLCYLNPGQRAAHPSRHVRGPALWRTGAGGRVPEAQRRPAGATGLQRPADRRRGARVRGGHQLDPARPPTEAPAPPHSHGAR